MLGFAGGSLHTISYGTLTLSRWPGRGSRSPSSKDSSGTPTSGSSVYLRGIDNAEIIDTVHERRAPVMPASAGLRFSP
jgi:hypothetical protein